MLVEVVLHAGGERVVDEVGEVLLEQVRPTANALNDGTSARALLPDVPAVLDRLDGRRVGRRATDAQLLEPLDQRRLGEAGRRLGLVAVRLDLAGVERVALGQRRQLALLLVGVVALVAVVDVGQAEALVGDDRADSVGRTRRRRPAQRVDWRPRRTVTVSPVASVICEAMVRFQISS